MTPRLVVFSGVPGTGKSTLARVAAGELGVPVWAKDELEAALRRCGLPDGVAGYELLLTVVGVELSCGRDVVCDAVFGRPSGREQLAALAERHCARLRVVECVVRDESVHRARIAGRRRGIDGWYELTWDDVRRSAAGFVPWDAPRLVLDAEQPLAGNSARLKDYLASGATAG